MQRTIVYKTLDTKIRIAPEQDVETALKGIDAFYVRGAKYGTKVKFANKLAITHTVSNLRTVILKLPWWELLG